MTEETNSESPPGDEPVWIRPEQCLYKVLKYHHDEDWQMIENDLNEWGLKGWELVSVTQVPLQHDYWNYGDQGVRRYNFQTTIYLKAKVGAGIPLLDMNTKDAFLRHIDQSIDEIYQMQRDSLTNE